MPKFFPCSQTLSQALEASLGWHQISKPNSPVYPVLDTIIGVPKWSSILAIANLNHWSSFIVGWTGAVQTNFSIIFLLLGPWTEILWIWSVEDFTQTLYFFFLAYSLSQVPPYSWPPIHRKLSLPRRKIVPSSIIQPFS